MRETQFGAISSGSQFEKIKHYIEIAKNENGNILIGGQAIKLEGRCEKGWFIEPSIIENLDRRKNLAAKSQKWCI